MSSKVFFLLVLFLILITPSSVLAVGIGKYSSNTQMVFSPGLEASYEYSLFDSPRIRASVEGDLGQYAVLKDPDPNGGPRNVIVSITLPEYIEPGVHHLYLVATQSSENGGTIGGIASVRTPITVFALYPGKRPEFSSFSVDDLNINEKTDLRFNVINYGEELIDSASAEVSIYDEAGALITTLQTSSSPVEPFQTVTVAGIFDSAQFNLPIGRYKATAKYFYDGKEFNQTGETEFIIGSLNVDIVDTTREVIVNATNKYYITVESDWSGDITNVYARVTLPSGKIIKSPNIDLVKSSNGIKANGIIELYMETNDMPLGENNLQVAIYYNKLTTEKTIPVTVINGIAPEIEKPGLPIQTLAIIGGGILLLGLIIYFIFFKSGGGSSRVSGSPASNTSSSSDIRPPTL
ncbi:MAG TPA: hypothetical protein VEC16_02705 [Alphaproteobacteria bacterium]|nr:hypothetical protein [Alphaproteobacteria bacterium]